MSTTTSTPAPGSAGTLTIHHDYESGTTVVGTTKNSPAHHAIKANRSWTWSRYAGAWLLRSSRHRAPKLGDIALIERTLTGLDYTVTREIDEAMPSVEQREADLAERMDERADRLAERSDNWAGKAATSRAKADAVFDRIPFGQPVMPGHHSYKADVNRRERARDNLGRSWKESDHANELARRSDVAARHMDARHNPVTVGNRIEKLHADRRAVQRLLDGEGALETVTDEHGNTYERSTVRPPVGEHADRLNREAADLDEQIAYWQRVYAELQAEGKASTASKDTVHKGDWVLVRGQWYRVRRANQKTVSVPSHIVTTPAAGEREYTDTTPWHEVRQYRTTEQMPAAFVAAYEEPGRERFRLNLADFPNDTAPNTEAADTATDVRVADGAEVGGSS
jgi:prefoldin subunit 5